MKDSSNVDTGAVMAALVICSLFIILSLVLYQIDQRGIAFKMAIPFNFVLTALSCCFLF